uniref:glycoside hydrolase family 16 protein n=1 Tax=Parerythrobacter lutipelagi TaxID=1964208 RepID=UPI001F02A633|nr:glycoside hydrolase family 16 protein [Parerythrobacter lutipelagi]
MPAINRILAAVLAFFLAACGNSLTSDKQTEVIDQVSLPAPGEGRMPALESGWDLVWSDEFDGALIDTGKWSLVADCWGGGNEERQCYVDRSDNASLEDGKLVITALRQEHTGAAWPDHMRGSVPDADAQATKPFTSAKLVTKGKASWRYGRIEVSARFPQGQGTWPAIWMLPQDDAYGGWAASGEIDILETVNLGVDCDECPGGRENTILGTLHFGGEWPDNAFNSTETHAPAVLDGQFHTYGIIWAPGVIEWTFDGVVFARKQAGDWWSGNAQHAKAPFDQPFYLILNLAIGGGLPEGRGLGGVSEAGFPKRMEVDWVRVWECNPDLAAKRHCASKQGE